MQRKQRDLEAKKKEEDERNKKLQELHDKLNQKKTTGKRKASQTQPVVSESGLVTIRLPVDDD